MRRIAPVVVLVFGFLFANVVVAQGIKVGDVVCVVHRAEVGAGGRVVAIVDVGNTLVVGAVEDDALWVTCKASGWIGQENVLPLDTAEKTFAAQRDAKPNDAEALYALGRIHQAQEKWDLALADFSAAIEASPNQPSYHLARAAVYSRKRNHEAALADYGAALEIDQLDHQAYRMRAATYVEMRNYREALADYNIAARLFPNDGALNNDRAWLLATCPDETYRNGEQAVRDATLACELCGWKAYNRLGTLAAAYAELGEFDKAVEWQSKCLKIAPASSRQAQASRLILYEAGKPHREVAGLWK